MTQVEASSSKNLPLHLPHPFPAYIHQILLLHLLPSLLMNQPMNHTHTHSTYRHTHLEPFYPCLDLGPDLYYLLHAHPSRSKDPYSYLQKTTYPLLYNHPLLYPLRLHYPYHKTSHLLIWQHLYP